MNTFPEFFQFRCPTKLVYGVDLSKDFSAELEQIACQRFFVVSDKVLEKMGLLQPIVDGVSRAGKQVTGVFTEVPSDSGVAVIERCAAEAKQSGAEGMIAIGGGSVLDTAKGANILLSLGGSLVDDYSGAQTITRPLNPLIAIPTTAGTGSEVTEAIVIRDETSGAKLTFVDEHLLPTLAILDPELTVSMPPKITAATGMDALTHAIEAMASIQRAPASDALALQAISLIFENLLTAVKEPKDIAARGAMLTAASLAGIAFDHAKVGVVHAVAHTVGGMFHIHHGTANSIFLPYGMEYNFAQACSVYARMAAAVGAVRKSEEENARQMIQAVRRLQSDLEAASGLPQRFSAFKVTRKDLPTVAEAAVEDGASFQNPRPVEADALLPFLEQAL